MKKIILRPWVKTLNGLVYYCLIVSCKIFYSLLMMSSHHNYNIRNNSQASSETNDNPENNPTSCETSDLILNLEKKLLSRFDGLLNLEDIVIKELQLENQRLRKKVSDLQKKIYSAEENVNSFEQYGRRNNIEITGILESVGNEKLEETVVEVLIKLT